jgi:hypothetical protein
MRIQTRRHIDEQARAMSLLRADLRETRAHAAQLAADLTKTRQRADLAEAEAVIARESLTKGHGELLAANQRLRIANRELHKQVNNAMGYGPAEQAVIDAGGEQALAAAERAARAELAKAVTE